MLLLGFSILITKVIQNNCIPNTVFGISPQVSAYGVVFRRSCNRPLRIATAYVYVSVTTKIVFSNRINRNFYSLPCYFF